MWILNESDAKRILSDSEKGEPHHDKKELVAVGRFYENERNRLLKEYQRLAASLSREALK